MHNLDIQKIIDQFLHEDFYNDLYDYIIKLLENIIQSDRLTGSLHPLGFIIVTIKDWDEGQRLRLHIWPEKGRKYNNDQDWIHNHEYSVNSLVLMGKVVNNRFDVIIDSSERTLPVFRVSYDSKNSDLILTNETCDVILTQRDELMPGDFYNVQKWNYHMVNIEPNTLVCTLVLNYEKEMSTGYVIGSSNTTKIDMPYTRHSYNRTELKVLISKLITYLSNRIQTNI